MDQWTVKTVRGNKVTEKTVSLNTIRKGVLDGDYLADDEVREEGSEEWIKLRQRANIFDLEAMVNKGGCFHKNYQQKDAARQCRNTIAFKDSMATAWFLLAILIENDDPTEAEMAYANCIAQNYKEGIAYNNKGVLMVRANEANIALDCFEKSVELSPDLAAPHYNLGMIYRHFHETALRRDKNYEEEYKKEFRSAWELDKVNNFYDKFDDTWGEHRANFLFKNEISKAFGVEPDRDRSNREAASKFTEEGFSYIEKGKWDEALTSFSIAQKHNPDLKHTINEWIYKANDAKRKILYAELDVLLKNEKFDKAIETTREIVSLGVTRKEIEKIIDDIRMAKAKYFYRIGSEYKKEEKYKEAKKSFGRASVSHEIFAEQVKSQIDDIDRAILLRKVEEYRQKGEYERAISAAEEMLYLGDFWREDTERLIDYLKKEKAEILFDEAKEAMDRKDYTFAEHKLTQAKETHYSFNDLASQKMDDLYRVKINDILTEAKQFLSQNKLDEVLTLADNLPDNTEMQLLKEKAYSRKLTILWAKARECEIRNERDTLVELYEEILKLDPQNVKAQESLKRVKVNMVGLLCQKGERELGKKDWDTAKQLFEEALSIDPNCKKALQGRKDAEYKLENPEDQSEEMDKARDAYLKGKKFLDKGNYDKADKEFKTAIELRPDYEIAIEAKKISLQKKIDSLFSKACLLEHENNEEALRLIEEVMQLSQGQHEQADQMRERIRLQKKVNEHLNRAKEFEEKGDLINAIKEYDKVMELAPQDDIQHKIDKCLERFYYSKIEKILKAGGKEDVLGSLKIILELSPRHFDSIKELLFDKANKLINEKRFLEALKYLDTLPDFPDLLKDIEVMKHRISSQLSFFDRLKFIKR